jgi:transcriptional regulator with XRE-family HTH domain
MTDDRQSQSRPPKTIFDPQYIALIKHLRVRRIELGLTQGDVAMQMGVVRTFVVRVEQRERRLDILELRRWLDVLGLKLVDVEAILAGEERP